MEFSFFNFFCWGEYNVFERALKSFLFKVWRTSDSYLGGGIIWEVGGSRGSPVTNFPVPKPTDHFLLEDVLTWRVN